MIVWIQISKYSVLRQRDIMALRQRQKPQQDTVGNISEEAFGRRITNLQQLISKNQVSRT